MICLTEDLFLDIAITVLSLMVLLLAIRMVKNVYELWVQEV